jgi:putative inorganic carbon (hco3(-)) transporter
MATLYPWQTASAGQAAAKREDYPLAFWSLVFFTFIVFVAPQNAYPVLVPLHLAKVSALLAVATYAGQRLSRGQKLLPSGPEFRLLAVLVLIAAVSAPFSLWPSGSLDVLTDIYLKSIATCLLTATLLTSVKRVKQMLWAMILFCFCAAIIALSQRGEKLVEGYRMAGSWAGISANPNDFALTINLILPFAVAFFIQTRNLVGKLFVGGFMVIAVGAVMATYSRTGLLTLATVLLLALIKHLGRGQGLKYVLPAALIVMAALSSLPQNYETRVESIMDASKDKVGSASARLAGIRAALDVIEEGLYWAHVHNVYLQLAAEIGIPGAVVFIVLLWRLLKGLRQSQARIKDNPAAQDVALLTTACEISLVAFSVAALFHPVAYHFYFYYFAGFALALKRLAEKAEAVPAEAPQQAPGWTYQPVRTRVPMGA